MRKLFLSFAALCFSACVAHAALAIDGTATNNTLSGASSGTATLTTTQSSGVVIAACFNEDGGSGGPYTLSSVTATGLTFTALSGAAITGTGTGQIGTSHDDLAAYYAPYTSSFSSKVITFHLSGTTDDAVCIAFGISGASTSGSPLDSAGAATSQSTTTGNVLSSNTVTLSTNNANDMLVLFTASQQNFNSIAAGKFGSNTPTLVTTLINNAGGSFAASMGVQYYVASSTQSSDSSYLNGDPAGNYNVYVLAFGIQAAGAAAPVVHLLSLVGVGN